MHAENIPPATVRIKVGFFVSFFLDYAEYDTVFPTNGQMKTNIKHPNFVQLYTQAGWWSTAGSRAAPSESI